MTRATNAGARRKGRFSIEKVYAISLFFSLISLNAMAQFTGPSATGQPSTVEQVQQGRLGTYVTLTGHLVAHQRGDYFTFRDPTGDVRVEIEPPVWQSRKIGPETKVRLLAEIDQGSAGRYLWVKSLEIVD